MSWVKKLVFLMILVAICMFFFMPKVSAWEFDNVLVVEDNGREHSRLLVKDAFGLGDDLVRMEIIDDGHECFIECSAIINVTLYENGVLPSEFEFYNSRGRGANKEYNYYIQEEDKMNYTFQNVTRVCEEAHYPNGSIYDSCENRIDFTEEREWVTPRWVRYNGDAKRAGEYIYKIEAKKGPTERIDWTFGFIGISADEIREEWAWWDSSWSRKKPITITGAVPANYSLRLNVTYDADMQTNFNDLRFTNNAEDTEIPYWIEETIISTEATIYVNIQDNSTIYMYYGNATVTNISNINTTFMFADEFDGPVLSDLDPNKWGEDGSPNYIISSGIILFTASGWGNSLYSNITFTQAQVDAGIKFLYETNRNDPSGQNIRAGLNNGTSTLTDGGFRGTLYHSSNTGYDTDMEVKTGGDYWYLPNQKAGDPYRHELWYDGTNANATSYNATRLLSEQQTWTTGAGDYRFVIEGSGGTAMSFDWVAISPYAAGVVPTFGAEIADYSVVLDLPKDGSSTTNTTIDFQCTVSATASNISNITLDVWNSTGDFVHTNFTAHSGTETQMNHTTTLGALTEYNWTCDAWFVDGTNKKADNFTFEIVPATIDSLSWNNITTEGAYETFTINLTLNPSFQLTTSYLNYNNTNYTATIVDADGILSRSLTVPATDSEINKSFYWVINFEDGSNITSSTYNQTVKIFTIDDCSTNNVVLYNFTIVDEAAQYKLNQTSNNTEGKVDITISDWATDTSLHQYNGTFTQTNPFAVCINSTLNNSERYHLDGVVQYKADDYQTEFYHFQNDTLDQSYLYQNITLYDLKTTEAQVFTLIMKDGSFLAIQDAIVEIYRRYVDEGTYKIVEIPKTDSNGETLANLVVDDVIYKFIIKKEGVVIATFSDVRADCQNPTIDECTIDFFDFSTGIEIPNYETEADFNYTLDFNKATRTVTSQFIITSGTVATILLDVEMQDALATQVCTDSLTSTSGTLSCIVPTSFGNSTVLAKLYKDNVLIAQGTLNMEQDPSDIYGGVLIALALLVFLTLLGAGLSDNPVFTTIFMMIGVIILFAMNLVANNGFIGGTATILWLVIAAIIMIIKGAKRN